MENTMFSAYPDVITVNDLAKMLKVGLNTAYSLLRSGEIPSKRWGRKYYICKSNVIAFLNQ